MSQGNSFWQISGNNSGTAKKIVLQRKLGQTKEQRKIILSHIGQQNLIVQSYKFLFYFEGKM